jgi:hypothetical protein
MPPNDRSRPEGRPQPHQISATTSTDSVAEHTDKTRLPCRTKGCRGTRPVVPLSVRWHDRCWRCAVSISNRSSRARWGDAA